MVYEGRFGVSSSPKGRLRVSDGKTGQGGDVWREERPCSMAERANTAFGASQAGRDVNFLSHWSGCSQLETLPPNPIEHNPLAPGEECGADLQQTSRMITLLVLPWYHVHPSPWSRFLSAETGSGYRLGVRGSYYEGE